MPWTILAGLTDRDIDALHAYLRSLGPVRNVVPPPEPPSVADGLLGKLSALATGHQMAGVYHPGNVGHEAGDGEHIVPVVNPRAELLLALACAGAILVHRLARRPRGERLALASVLVLGVMIYAWPPLRWMPPALVKATGPLAAFARAFGLPPLRPPPEPVPTGDSGVDTLARRGRYVATVGTCPLCHTAGPDPLRLWAAFPDMGGGMRVGWKVFGTAWSRNLTPDPETGLGRWSDAEVKRAITSGVARNGRLMHWQAMPWDHFSRLSPEDLEALVVYLRQLPAVHSEVPPPVPPRLGDAEGDSFAFGYSGRFRR
jgi:mono/diheme cytochrome c family protein